MNISILHIRFHTLLNAMALAAAILLLAGCTDEPDFGDQEPSTTLQKSGGNKVNKPKLSEEKEISCTYSDGNLHFRCHDIGGLYRLNVRDADSGQSISYRVDSFDGDISISIGQHSSISLELNTEEGTYTGHLKTH